MNYVKSPAIRRIFYGINAFKFNVMKPSHVIHVCRPFPPNYDFSRLPQTPEEEDIYKNLEELAWYVSS